MTEVSIHYRLSDRISYPGCDATGHADVAADRPLVLQQLIHAAVSRTRVGGMSCMMS